MTEHKMRLFDYLLMVELRELDNSPQNEEGDEEEEQPEVQQTTATKRKMRKKKFRRSETNADWRSPLVQVISYRFPLCKPIHSLKFIAEFCFPDVEAAHSSSSPSPISHPSFSFDPCETFSFVLTETSGEKRWGYCRRIMPYSQHSISPFPVCFCIMSFIPCFSIFSKLLDHIIERIRRASAGKSLFLSSSSLIPAPVSLLILE